MSRDSRDVAGRGSDYDETGLHVHVERGDDKDRNVIIRAQRYPQARLSVMLAVMAVAALTVLLLSQPRPAQLDRLDDRPGAAGQTTTAVTSTTYLPLVMRNFSIGEWTQHAHDAQHTSYTNQVVSTPWRWKWAWNGPNASGGVSSGKFKLPRNSQPVTGDDRVYIAAGSNGVYALNSNTGTVVWNSRPGGNINSTPAYDAGTRAVFVVSSNGTLYKLNAVSGSTLNSFATGSSSTLPLPPAIVADRVFFSMGNRVYAVNAATMALIWSYDAGAAVTVDTPPAYSPSRNRVIVVSSDLFVHAIENASGARAWRVKPTVRIGGEPTENDPQHAEAKFGWPVIAEAHGYVLIKLRLDWQSLWIPNPWPGTNSAMRSFLQSQPAYQALFTMDLDDGTTPFVANVGHGGFGDGGYLPMGPQPVIKRFADGQEIAYVVMRGSPCLANPCDGRWDAHLGEMLLDGTSVSGYQAGYVRFIRNTFFPTDEQANLAMAGEHLFGGHWMFGIAHQILDRSSSKGSGSNPITTSDLPHIITSASNCGFSASHYCSNGLLQDGDSRAIPRGFYIYYNQGKVYDQYWSGYAAWVVSNGLILFTSTDGAVVALEAGSPTGSAADSLAPNEAQTALSVTAGQNAAHLIGARPPVSPANEAETRKVIPYTQAAMYDGQVVTVEGILRFIFNNRKAVYLGFQNPHQGAFKIRIMKEYWGQFGAPAETLYEVNQRVRVTGLIEWYQGDPVIYVTEPAQIDVVGDED
jgi:hypothetical protein